MTPEDLEHYEHVQRRFREISNLFVADTTTRWNIYPGRFFPTEIHVMSRGIVLVGIIGDPDGHKEEWTATTKMPFQSGPVASAKTPQEALRRLRQAMHRLQDSMVGAFVALESAERLFADEEENDAPQ